MPIWFFFTSQEGGETEDFVISGIVQEQGSPVSRTVRLYLRTSGELINEVTSESEDGSFIFSGLTEGEEYYVIALDDTSDETDYNLLGYDRIIPVMVSGT